MAMTPEAKVKKKVAAHLKTLGAYYFYPVTGGYGKSGVPDIIGCHKGIFFGIECKAGKNKPTPLQEKNLTDIKTSGGISLVINEDNIDDVLIYVGGQNRDPRQFEFDFEASEARHDDVLIYEKTTN
jgi:Holliday junction resolvase